MLKDYETDVLERRVSNRSNKRREIEKKNLFIIADKFISQEMEILW